MNIDEKIALITRNTDEVLTREDLKDLIGSGTPLTHYIGFEISGKVHLGTGLLSMGKVADFLKAGVSCQIFLADFHTYLNKKLDGKLETIRKVSDEYFKPALIASLKCHEVDVDKVLKEGKLKFINGRDLYKDNLVHWETFMEVGQHTTLSRNLRSISITGKKEGKSVDMATLFYPPLQVADIFTMRANIAHAGMDQRKAHVIARQVAGKLTINPLKDKDDNVISPIAIHQTLIAGLEAPKKGQGDEEVKMSKSKPKSAVYIHDSPKEIRKKINSAYCPLKETKMNPIINWTEKLVFWGEEKGEFLVKRPKKFGGNKLYETVSELKKDYESENLHPQDLKLAVSDWLIAKLKPARDYFKNSKRHKALEILEKILS